MEGYQGNYSQRNNEEKHVLPDSNIYIVITFKRVLYRFRNMKVEKWTKRENSEINWTCISI